MLLPQHELDNFSYFGADHKFGIDQHYNTTCDDIIVITYSKMKSFLGFKYRKEWHKKHIISRFTKDGMWHQNLSASALIAQLQQYEANNWNYIQPELYKRLSNLHPEMFL